MQKQIWIKKNIFIGLFPLFLAVLLSACGKEKEEGVQKKYFGIDYSEELAVMQSGQVICGQDNVWAITMVKNDFIYNIPYNTSAAEIEKIEWKPGEGNYSIVNVAERRGILYAQIKDMEKDTIEIRKYLSGQWSDVMSIKTENNESYAVVGSTFFVDSSENVYLVNQDKVAHFDGEGKLKYVYELRGNICFFQENKEGYVECVAADANEITLYEFRGSKAEKRWSLEVSAGRVHSIQGNQEGILCLATNTEILFLDNESGNLTAKANLVNLGVTEIMTGRYDAEEGLLQLYGSEENGGRSLLYSSLSERDETAEQRTELVYGMVGESNADVSSSIWTAITKFNQENKEYYVTIKNYDGWFNLERLHADMAGGNGPDIIDMTYSEYYESYVKNGYLENLSPYLEESQYADDIIWNVLDAYKINGGLYLFIPQFQLHGLLLHPEYEVFVDEWNMETFLAFIRKNQWEKDILGGMGDSQSLLQYMLYGRQEEFIDWEQKTAAFETEEFVALLALCREYSQADWSDVAEWTYDEKKRNTLCMPCLFGGGFMTYLSNVDIYGREYQVYGYPTLSGQAYGINACADSCGIYSGSKHKDGAWEFIESLLWESNQKYSGMVQPGFPVRSSLLKEMEAENRQLRINGEVLTITDNEISILEDIIYKEELRPIMIDSDIWSVILEETTSYFAGDKSAEETAHIIQSRVQIILEE